MYWFANNSGLLNAWQEGTEHPGPKKATHELSTGTLKSSKPLER
ncbi:hypothetical protein SNOG_10496 [Parastagonospora nodorum SN15]|uniref:Uncharacterized protein n=1 Tax=Phaeosphaeria nodorum (strain SN15 / ATCC MYA-4574 / FGSC 10173) TaxID=321614 RepID=Q0UCL8_PHANO|nr:hypothetical protein SNOG_10496 [Parastagonospora nodorum SN15]EAT81890.1 hypothetical protein SNOG_10496 [Parastagonospora nodorum SN15]